MVKITVLSPHQDDAAFSIGLAIDVWIGEGHAVEVVNCFTKSTYSPQKDFGLMHANDLQSFVSGRRRHEDERWSRSYSSPVMLSDLGLPDAPQRLQRPVDQVCDVAPSQEDAAMPKIRLALEPRVEGALILPLGLGDHVDHLTARLAAQEGWPETLPIAFYEDLPYAARPGVADMIQARVTSVVAGLQPGFACGPSNIMKATARKRDLARCYESQIDADGIETIARFCERYDGRERLWMNHAWRSLGLGA